MNGSGIVRAIMHSSQCATLGIIQTLPTFHSLQRSKAAEELLNRLAPRPKSVTNLSGAPCEIGLIVDLHQAE